MTNVHVQINNGVSYIQYCMSLIDITGVEKSVLFMRDRTRHLDFGPIAVRNQHLSYSAVRDILMSARDVARDVMIKRSARSSVEPYMFMHNMCAKSQKELTHLIKYELDLSYLDVRCVQFRPPYSLSKENRQINQVVTAPAHWTVTVRDRGLSIVKANDGKRIVICANEKKVERLNAANIQLFKGQALKFKSRTHKYELHDAWIMRHAGYDGNVITALHEDLTKAEQLINRRIRRAVTEALDV